MSRVDWKAQSRKHERRAKAARKLIARLCAEIRVPSADPAARVAEITAEVERLYEEKRTIRTGLGDPFQRSAPADGSQEIIVARSSHKRLGEAPPVLLSRSPFEREDER